MWRENKVFRTKQTPEVDASIWSWSNDYFIPWTVENHHIR